MKFVEQFGNQHEREPNQAAPQAGSDEQFQPFPDISGWTDDLDPPTEDVLKYQKRELLNGFHSQRIAPVVTPRRTGGRKMALGVIADPSPLRCSPDAEDGYWGIPVGDTQWIMFQNMGVAIGMVTIIESGQARFPMFTVDDSLSFGALDDAQDVLIVSTINGLVVTLNSRTGQLRDTPTQIDSPVVRASFGPRCVLLLSMERCLWFLEIRDNCLVKIRVQRWLLADEILDICVDRRLSDGACAISVKTHRGWLVLADEGVFELPKPGSTLRVVEAELEMLLDEQGQDEFHRRLDVYGEQLLTFGDFDVAHWMAERCIDEADVDRHCDMFPTLDEQIRRVWLWRHTRWTGAPETRLTIVVDPSWLLPNEGQLRDWIRSFDSLKLWQAPRTSQLAWLGTRPLRSRPEVILDRMLQLHLRAIGEAIMGAHGRSVASGLFQKILDSFGIHSVNEVEYVRGWVRGSDPTWKSTVGQVLPRRPRDGSKHEQKPSDGPAYEPGDEILGASLLCGEYGQGQEAPHPKPQESFSWMDPGFY